MTELSAERARNFADEMDVIEDAIAGENIKKAALIDAMRGAFKDAKFVGPEITLEVAKLRGAISRRRLMRTDEKKARKASEKAEGIDIYFDVITALPRVHTQGTPKLALVQTEVQTPHDADGVIIEQADGADVVGLAEQLHRHAAAGNTDALTVIAAAKYGPDVMRAVAAGILERDEQNPEPGAGVESMGNGARSETAETMPEPNPGNAAGRTAEDRLDRAEGASPSHAKTPAQAVPGKIVEPFIPDPAFPRVRNIGPEPEMPAFLKRATTDQVGRA